MLPQSQWAPFIKRRATELGFMACGISKAEFLEEEAPRLETWLTRRMNGKMGYMENHFSGRRNTASNPVLFPDVFNSVGAFLNLAQQIEDAAVAIYKSQVAFLATDKPLLDAVVRMHNVEARHAAHMRLLRHRSLSAGRVKGWPSPADTAPSPTVQVPRASSSTLTSIYTFEANETQIIGSRLVPFATLLTNASVVQFNALAEAFDEPLPTIQATVFLNIFG